MLPDVGAPPPKAESSACEPWTDQLSKALATGIPRRTVLKLVAGAAFTSMFGLTTACGSSPTTPSTTPTPTASSASQCPPLEQELCCTPAQLQACEQQGADLFAQAMFSQCASACSTTQTPTPECQACIQASINQSLAAYTTCTAETCLVLVDQFPPAASTPSPTALRPGTVPSAPSDARGLLASTFTERVSATAGVAPCNYADLEKCRTAAEDAADRCFYNCQSSECSSIKGSRKACSNCARGCYDNLTKVILSCLAAPCPHGTFCGVGDLCCPPDKLGCVGISCCGVRDTCCADGSCCASRTCCGDTCCPATSTCVNGKCQCQGVDHSGQTFTGTLCGRGSNAMCCKPGTTCCPRGGGHVNLPFCFPEAGFICCGSGFPSPVCPSGSSCCADGCC